MSERRYDSSGEWSTGVFRGVMVAACLAMGCAHAIPVGFPDEAPTSPLRACAPTVAARSDTLMTTLYATTGYNPRATPDVNLYRNETARRLLSFMLPPDRVTAPMLEMAPVAPDSAGEPTSSGPLLDADLLVVLDRSGHITATRFVRAPEVPELTGSLMDAVRRADSAHALAPLPDELAGATAELTIRIFGTGSRLPPPVDTAAPVFTIAEPRFVVRRVDVAPRILPVTGPRYPTDLRRAGVHGLVEMQFIVDAMGRVDPSSARVVYESHPAFTASIREAMPALRFTPARIGGCSTRSWVRQRFEFRLDSD